MLQWVAYVTNWLVVRSYIAEHRDVQSCVGQCTIFKVGSVVLQGVPSYMIDINQMKFQDL